MPETENKIHHAFTIKRSNVVNRLESDVDISSNGNKMTCKAIWDTGATRTSISFKVAADLNLVRLGFLSINTPSGATTVNTYCVDVSLSNDITIKDVRVCDSAIGDQGIDVLVGMDIISQGDFAVSNYDGCTTFTFCIPARKAIDFTKEIRIQNITGTHGKGKSKKRKK